VEDSSDIDYKRVWRWFEKKHGMKLTASDLKEIYLRTCLEGNHKLDKEHFPYDQVGYSATIGLLWRQNAHFIACFGLTIWAIGSPSIIAGGLLLLGFAGFLIPNKYYAQLRHGILWYSLAYILIQYGCNIGYQSGLVSTDLNSTEFELYQSIGLTYHSNPLTGLGYQILGFVIFIFIYVLNCPQIWSKHYQDKDIMRHTSATKNIITRTMVKFVQFFAYLVLGLMYFIGIMPVAEGRTGVNGQLEGATLLVAGYVIISVIFICAYGIVKKMWLVPTIYTQLVVLIQFIVQFGDFVSVVGIDASGLLGFRHVNMPWRNCNAVIKIDHLIRDQKLSRFLMPYTAMMFLTALQLNFFRMPLHDEKTNQSILHNSGWYAMEQNNSRMGFVYRHIFARSQTTEHLLMLTSYIWLLYLPLTQNQAVTSSVVLVLFFLCLHSLKYGVNGWAHSMLWTAGIPN